MGYCFALHHANLVGYLTTPTAQPPRVSEALVGEALGGMAHGSDGIPSLISRDADWLQRMKQLAELARSQIGGGSESELPAEKLQALLQPIRRELARFDVYALVVDDQRDRAKSDELAAIARELAYSSGGHALILWALSTPGESIAVLDPLPAFAEALEHPDRWPGMLFWTATGTCAMVALSDLGKIADAIRHASVDRIEEAIRNAASARRSRRLLHLSDLHFGAKSVAENVVTLEAHLDKVIKQVDRVVITGDLFNTPDRTFAAAFRNFDHRLQRLMSGKSPIVIPGNHDIRLLGNLGSFYEHIPGTRWQPVVVDEEIGVNFSCFNSCEEGQFARGRISKEQLQRVGGDLHNELATHPEYEEHLNVALVHHHPFSFKTAEKRTFVQRVLAVLGMNEETFLQMVDPEEFLNWCARWRVSAVLHGHKHVARHMTARISPEGSAAYDVTAIGCGSSLGAEGSPMSYVLLHWDDRSRRWSTSFFESRNGGPFVRQAATSTVVQARA
jgi:calcineurin-like phosphoesterase family protein